MPKTITPGSERHYVKMALQSIARATSSLRRSQQRGTPNLVEDGWADVAEARSALRSAIKTLEQAIAVNKVRNERAEP